MHRVEAKFVADWYAVMVLPKNEFRISKLISEKFGIKSFVPSQKVWKLKNGSKVVKNKPLMGSYVFIMSDLNNINWRLFYSVGGIFGFVKNAGKPASIPEEHIANLEKLCVSTNPVCEIDCSKLRLNERVEVIDGPLRGAVGNYIKLNEKTGKFIVKLDLFKRALVTELDEGLIKPF